MDVTPQFIATVRNGNGRTTDILTSATDENAARDKISRKWAENGTTGMSFVSVQPTGHVVRR